jgi:hypothetical protein
MLVQCAVEGEIRAIGSELAEMVGRRSRTLATATIEASPRGQRILGDTRIGATNGPPLWSGGRSSQGLSAARE